MTHTYSVATAEPRPLGTFSDVLEARRSERILSRCSLSEVGACLSLAMRPRYLLVGDPYARSRSPALSAGALHPIDVALVVPAGSPRVFKYEPRTHALLRVHVARPDDLANFLALAKEVLPNSSAVLAVLVGDARKPRAVYRRSVSLLWRDAGALQETLHLCATALGLGFCPLGILGDGLIRSVFGDARAPVGLGVAAIGVRVPRSPEMLNAR